MDFTWSGLLAVPVIVCSGQECPGITEGIHPLEVGCMDGSTGGYKFWVTLQVLEQYRMLQFAGLGAQGTAGS